MPFLRFDLKIQRLTSFTGLVIFQGLFQRFGIGHFCAKPAEPRRCRLAGNLLPLPACFLASPASPVLLDHPPLHPAHFLLRPDAATNNAFLYCLIAAAVRCEIEVLLPCAMSNHYHAVIYDRAGRYPEFLKHFHKLMARSQNTLRGRWENFWSSEQTYVVKLIGRDTVIDKLVYVATNPVLDDLVDRVHLWSGVNGLAALLNGRTLRATRPLHFFRRDGSMPDAFEMPLTIPPKLGPAAQVISELRDRERAVEQQRAAERQRTGRRVLGRRAVLAQSWRERPTTCEPRRNLRPQVAARSRWARIEALLRNRAFCRRVRRCRAHWRAGLPAVFPPGTYWLQRFASVPVLQT